MVEDSSTTCDTPRSNYSHNSEFLEASDQHSNGRELSGMYLHGASLILDLKSSNAIAALGVQTNLDFELATSWIGWVRPLQPTIYSETQFITPIRLLAIFGVLGVS